jgi:AraC family transcriptional regulator
MSSTSVDEILAKRFRIDRPPTLVARKYPRTHFAFSRMRCGDPMRGRSMAVPPEAAYSFHVPMTAPFFSDLWTGGRRKTIPNARLGDVFLFDLSENPRVALDTPFDSMRFYVPQAVLDEIANEEGTPRVKRLEAREFGGHDPIMYGLAQTLAGAMAYADHCSAMFCDHIALALFAHIAPVYGGMPVNEYARSALAPWQLRSAYEFIEENLGANPSISEVAKQCRLSSSYFSGAFKRACGFSPHRRLMKRRLERAKELMEVSSFTLAQIAQTCGFVDQSHFSRFFLKSEGCSPGRVAASAPRLVFTLSPAVTRGANLRLASPPLALRGKVQRECVVEATWDAAHGQCRRG